MKKIAAIMMSLIVGASFAVIAEPALCDMSKCQKKVGGYYECPKDACKVE